MKVYIETYGCQMNQADSGIVAKLLKEDGNEIIDNVQQADVILINTCAVRDNAEKRIHNRVHDLQSLKKKKPFLKIGIIGCMAERLKGTLQEEDKVNIVCGPDAYRKLPQMIKQDNGLEVELSHFETYEDIIPLQIDTDGISSFVSIMRGCENFCTYCVVPYTRGKERSRSVESIILQVKQLFSQGYRDITLLGQNVNSYNYDNTNFAMLLEEVAKVNPLLRVRFATSHPKDLSEQLVDVIAKYDNICKYIHLPIQSGSNKMLQKMNRKYTVEQYLQKIDLIRQKIPDCAISTDVIAGFCGETLEDHNMTLEVFSKVKYDSAYMFKYSNRPGTVASKRFEDDVPEKEKVRRLEEIIALQRELSLQSNQRDIGKTMEILVEGESKRDKSMLWGRNSQNKVVIFEKGENKKGEYIYVNIKKCTSATLFGEKI